MAKKNTLTESRIADSEQAMNEVFADYPRVTCFIPSPMSADGEPLADQVIEAAINGHAFVIRRGVTVSLPEPLYVVLKQTGRFEIP